MPWPSLPISDSGQTVMKNNVPRLRRCQHKISSTNKLAIEPKKNYIASINVEGTELADNEDMAVALFQFYEEVLGANFVRSTRIDLDSV